MSSEDAGAEFVVEAMVLLGSFARGLFIVLKETIQHKKLAYNV
jgi:hypothetical protein